MLSHIFGFSSANLKDLRDQQDMIWTSIMPWTVCKVFAIAVLNKLVFGQIFGFLVECCSGNVFKHVAQQEGYLSKHCSINITEDDLIRL